MKNIPSIDVHWGWCWSSGRTWKGFAYFVWFRITGLLDSSVTRVFEREVRENKVDTRWFLRQSIGKMQGRCVCLGYDLGAICPEEIAKIHNLAKQGFLWKERKEEGLALLGAMWQKLHQAEAVYLRNKKQEVECQREIFQEPVPSGKRYHQPLELQEAFSFWEQSPPCFPLAEDRWVELFSQITHANAVIARHLEHRNRFFSQPKKENT